MIKGGRLKVTFGSSIAYLGIKGKSLIAYLCLVSASVITAASVVSLPVPAVVGTAIRRGILLCTFRMPFILARDCFGFAILAPTALAQSILDPPPKPMMALQLLERNKSIASATFFVVGLATVLSYIVYLILFSESTFSRRFVRPSFMIPSSVIISTWLYLRFSRISGKALTLSRILGFLYGRNGSAIRKTV